MNEHILISLVNVINKRKHASLDKSYTAQLLNDSNLLAKKIGEESSELIVDLINKNKTGIINESADLIYHLLVSWVASGVEPEQIWKELSKRTLKSGIDEKQSRNKNDGL